MGALSAQWSSVKPGGRSIVLVLMSVAGRRRLRASTALSGAEHSGFCDAREIGLTYCHPGCCCSVSVPQLIR
ncbi:hypothetical protein AURDEDRAFT_112647 [Auricularia subglabra TFB-10046 SS5]|nr:hypothetical protein AURDEDRAFT_112647 [Auricularia subglabra TFB-10046 SS5]